MAVFTIHARDRSDRQRRFVYDNMASTLRDEDGKDVLETEGAAGRKPAPVTSRETPLAKTQPSVIKISLGLSCNYACTYCSQRFVPHADVGSLDDVQEFLRKLPTWYDGGFDREGRGTRFEFWGGEPLVYWKKLRILAGAIRAAYPHAELLIITNGSLLNPEINEWLDRMGFNVGLSHDGPGQHVRGPDPLEDPYKREQILDLWRRLGAEGRMSFNAMLNRENVSRAEIQRFFQELTGDETVPIGEGTFIDPYDEGGMATSLKAADRLAFRRRAFAEIVEGKALNFDTVSRKISLFITGLRHHRLGTSLGQKCGMDRPDNIAVDLFGNVLTCQNVSAAATAPNGESHKIGTTDDLAGVKLTTATHWSRRPDCANCPVLHLCQGACMFLEGELWTQACENAWNDNVVLFAAAIHFATQTTPYMIEGPHARERWWLFDDPPQEMVWRVVGRPVI